jgi:putative hydrolase of the HAD superfamily
MITVDLVTEVEPFLDGIDLVVFDLDDTLFPEKAYVRSGYDEIAKAFPAVENMSEKLWQKFLKKEKAIDAVLQDEGLYSQENLAKCVEIYRFQKPNIRLYEGVLEMLKRIKRSGKKLALITDGRVEGQRAKIDALGIAPQFDSVIITDELGGVEYRKPCEKAFVLTVERLGTDYRKAVYIGDNITKDFIAPERLGMRSILVKNADGLY